RVVEPVPARVIGEVLQAKGAAQVNHSQAAGEKRWDQPRARFVRRGEEDDVGLVGAQLDRAQRLDRSGQLRFAWAANRAEPRVRVIERDRFSFFLPGREEARQANVGMPSKPGDELAPRVAAGA